MYTLTPWLGPFASKENNHKPLRSFTFTLSSALKAKERSTSAGVFGRRKSPLGPLGLRSLSGEATCHFLVVQCSAKTDYKGKKDVPQGLGSVVS